MATLHDIARKAGVSIATVSNVLNNIRYVSPAIRARVLAAAKSLNYRPNAMARGLRLKRSFTVGMVVPDITDPFFPAMVRGAEDVLTRSGFTLIIGNSDNDAAKEESYYRTFLERQVDGLLTVPTGDSPPATLQRFHEQNIHVVYVDRFHADTASDIVVADDVEGTRRCVRHLATNGYRRIAAIAGPLKFSSSRARLEGYRLALQQSKLPEDENLIREGTFDMPSGLDCARQLLALKPRPDAFFVANASMACGVIQALEEADLSCPRDIAIACFDQLNFFELLRPRLTCVVVPPYDLGARAAELVLKRISGKMTGAGQRYSLRPTLFKRESSARIK